jgi:NAD(P)-dependent dehydrogenase (short-subunit alcohol dehydrogenase family)
MPGELRFDGQVALVTGGGRGLGREHCLLLAERGAAVVVNDIGVDVGGEGADPHLAEDVAGFITETGGRAIASTESVVTPDGALAMVERTLDAFGRIDVIVTNAGIIRDAPFDETDLDTLSAMLSTHTLGTWHVLQAAWPHLVAQGYGRVVCINSRAGLYGMPLLAAYGTAKAAIVGLVRSVALEGEPLGIKINAVAPAARSRMNANQSAGWEALGADHQRPDLVSPAVAFLAHELCPTTGRLFTCSGHRLAEIHVLESCGLATEPDGWTMEAIRDGWASVVDPVGAVAPRDVADAVSFGFACMGVNPADYGIEPAP